jgi:type IV secretion system protein VirB10
MVEREMDVPNTLEIRPGYRFNVMVNKDIAFQSPYRRR